MLVNLHLYMLGLSRQNDGLNDEIAAKHGNDKAMTKVVESLLPKEAMATLSQLRSSIRSEFYRRTLPWQDGGIRILSTGGYMDFTEFMRKAQAQWDPAVQYFVDNWDSYVADAQVKRNGLFRAEQYPTKEQVRKRFDFTYQVMPVPVADDFRAKVYRRRSGRHPPAARRVAQGDRRRQHGRHLEAAARRSHQRPGHRL